MRKVYVLVLILVVSVLFAAAATADPIADTGNIPEVKGIFPREATEECRAEESSLPRFLQIIEDDAFEGTALKNVELPETVKSVGDGAFGNNSELRTVHLPDEIEEIRGNPFEGSPGAVLSGSAKGKGRDWAQRNRIRFLLEVRFAVKEETRQFILMLPRELTKTEETESANERIIQQNKQIRTGRTDGELKAAAYDGVAALYVQSRYFP